MGRQSSPGVLFLAKSLIVEDNFSKLTSSSKHSRCSRIKRFYLFLIYHVEARVRDNKAGDERGGGGKHKTVGNRDNRRSVEGRGMGVNKMVLRGF